MALLTIFTAPKPFSDPHIAAIQRNAIRSWTLLPDTRVLVIGQEDGLAAAAAELGVRHLPEVRRNASGTPLVSSIFALAREHSDSPLLAYVNADILLMRDFHETARRLQARLERFLLVGQRWDLDVSAPLDFSPGWEERLLQEVRTHGNLHPPAGSDYFVFPRASFQNIPPFAVGRAGWDNWMIYQARAQSWPAVDGSRSITIVHQNHDYAHLPDGRTHHRLPESGENVRLAGGWVITRFNLRDTDRCWVNGHLRRRPLDGPTLRRRLEAFPLLTLGSYALAERLIHWLGRLDRLTGGR
jgi:hypothetical protein